MFGPRVCQTFTYFCSTLINRFILTYRCRMSSKNQLNLPSDSNNNMQSAWNRNCSPQEYPPFHLLLFLLGLLLLVNTSYALFWDRLYSHIWVPSQCLSSQSSNVSVICILLPLQLPKVFCQSLLIYFPHHLIYNFMPSFIHWENKNDS